MALRRSSLLFLLLAVCYVAFQTAVGRFVELDEVFFKAAGREWAASGRFAAPEIDGYPNWDGSRFIRLDPPLREVWFAQPPVYTFLFGLFTKAVGFGPRQCILFDALIHAALAAVTCRLARRLAGLSERAAFFVGVIVLPLGTAGRPDELALVFGTLGLLALLGPRLRNRELMWSGALLGICAATTAPAAVLLGLIGLVILLAGEESPWRQVRRMVLWTAAGAAAAAAAVAPVLIAHPDAYRQYLVHARWHFGPGDYLASFLRVWQLGKPYLALIVGCLVVGLGSFAAPKALFSAAVRHRWWPGPVLALAFLALFLPKKYFYLWFVGPWLMVVAAGTLAALARQGRRRQAHYLGLTLALGYVFAAAPAVRTTLTVLALPPTQSLAANAAAVRRVIRPDSVVLTDDYWWVLANDCRVRDPYFSQPAPHEVDYIILGGGPEPGSVRAVPAYLDAAVSEQFEVVYDNIHRDPPRLLGIPLRGGPPGFGVRILARRSDADRLAREVPRHD